MSGLGRADEEIGEYKLLEFVEQEKRDGLGGIMRQSYDAGQEVYMMRWPKPLAFDWNGCLLQDAQLPDDRPGLVASEESEVDRSALASKVCGKLSRSANVRRGPAAAISRFA